MKTKVKKDLHAKTLKELQTELKEAREQLFSLKLDKAQNKLKNLRAVFTKRKDIARILSIIKEKEFQK
ncbi:MAG: 50S ribosomal protein L29 [Candidatus Levybacteria bacterium]|nr:50S ribosomal protein L29 [Candidatus Levybacteria bacterium]